MRINEAATAVGIVMANDERGRLAVSAKMADDENNSTDKDAMAPPMATACGSPVLLGHILWSERASMVVVGS